MKELKEQKQAEFDKVFQEQADGSRVARVDPDDEVPCTACVLQFQNTGCFRMCVARNPKTPLTVLHLLQPMLGLQLLLSLIFLFVCTGATTGIIPIGYALMRGIQFFVLSLCVVASGSLLYVGRIASGVPSQETLNVTLNKNVDEIADRVVAQEGAADDAQKLEGMTLSWIGARSEDRDAVNKLRTQLRRDTEKFWAFQFKARLLRYLASGEQQRYKQDNAKLMADLRSRSDAKLSDYEMSREKLLPNGQLTLEELRRVMQMVAQTERESEYDFLDDVIQSLIEKLQADELEGQDIQMWSYAEIVEKVFEEASTNFAADFERCFKVTPTEEPVQHEDKQQPSQP